MVQNPEIAQSSTWAESLKAKSAGIFEKLRGSKDVIFDIALYGGFGFLVGYVAKKLSSYLITLIIFIVIIAALQQFEVIYVAINWAKIQASLGLQPVASADGSLMNAIWEWVRLNITISVSFIIGFLLGLKFGA